MDIVAKMVVLDKTISSKKRLKIKKTGLFRVSYQKKTKISLVMGDRSKPMISHVSLPNINRCCDSLPKFSGENPSNV
jgi:hypothetical protein